MDGTARRRLDVFLDLTPRCNLSCRMCFLPLEEGHGRGSEMDPAVFDRIVREVFPRAKSVALSCGAEPFLARRFLASIEAAAAARVPNIHFVTNGLLMTDAAIERIVELGVRRVAVSLDGASARTYEAIRVGGRFDRLRERLMALARIRRERGSRTPRITLSWVLMRSNLEEVPDLVDLAREVGADEVYFRHLIPFSERETADEGVYATPHWVNQVLALAWKRGWGHGIRFVSLPLLPPGRPTLGQRFAIAAGRTLDLAGDEGIAGLAAVLLRKWRFRRMACDQPWFTVYIRPDGSVLPCGAWFHDPPIGNLTSQSLDEILGGEDASRLRRELAGQLPPRPICEHCPNVVSGRTAPEAFSERRVRSDSSEPGEPPAPAPNPPTSRSQTRQAT